MDEGKESRVKVSSKVVRFRPELDLRDLVMLSPSLFSG